MVMAGTVDTDRLVYPPPGRPLYSDGHATLVVAMADTYLPGRRAFTVAVWLTIAVLAGIVGFTALTGFVDRMVQGQGAAFVLRAWSPGGSAGAPM